MRKQTLVLITIIFTAALVAGSIGCHKMTDEEVRDVADIGFSGGDGGQPGGGSQPPDGTPTDSQDNGPDVTAPGDLDGDGIPDDVDPDIDGDGIANADDDWPREPSALLPAKLLFSREKTNTQTDSQDREFHGVNLSFDDQQQILGAEFMLRQEESEGVSLRQGMQRSIGFVTTQPGSSIAYDANNRSWHLQGRFVEAIQDNTQTPPVQTNPDYNIKVTIVPDRNAEGLLDRIDVDVLLTDPLGQEVDRRSQSVLFERTGDITKKTYELSNRSQIPCSSTITNGAITNARCSYSRDVSLDLQVQRLLTDGHIEEGELLYSFFHNLDVTIPLTYTYEEQPIPNDPERRAFKTMGDGTLQDGGDTIIFSIDGLWLSGQDVSFAEDIAVLVDALFLIGEEKAIYHPFILR